jgi:purine-binding chemotaxis protein CheW
MIIASEHNVGATSAMPVNYDGVGRQRLLIMRAGANLCAVPLDNVIEVMRALPISPVASAPGYVRGLCIVRGEATVVVDAGLLIGGNATQCKRLVTVRTGERTVALAVTDVVGARSIAIDDFRHLPPLLTEVGNDAIAAIGTADAELLLLLRAARLIPPGLLDQVLQDGAQP